MEKFCGLHETLNLGTSRGDRFFSNLFQGHKSGSEKLELPRLTCKPKVGNMSQNPNWMRTYDNYWLVVSTYPSEKWWSESHLGWWKFPISWESHSKFHGSSHHQPDYVRSFKFDPTWHRKRKHGYLGWFIIAPYGADGGFNRWMQNNTILLIINDLLMEFVLLIVLLIVLCNGLYNGL